jgi:hypothetical protein
MTSSLPRMCSTTELQQRWQKRVKGIEPSYSAWKAAALPLSYTRDGEIDRDSGRIQYRHRSPNTLSQLTPVGATGFEPV